MKSIRYRSGYKYQLVYPYSVEVIVRPEKNIETRFIDLNTSGLLVIKDGYAWDGPSGPTIDTKNFMRGSLVHDALYQLMRDELLPASCREQADRELHRICREDGMSKFRAWYVLFAVRKFADFAASPESKKPELEAP
ncbi:MAG: hypothetical protein WC047_05635 [Kiritimatiellales bacterium]